MPFLQPLNPTKAKLGYAGYSYLSYYDPKHRCGYSLKPPYNQCFELKYYKYQIVFMKFSIFTAKKNECGGIVQDCGLSFSFIRLRKHEAHTQRNTMARKMIEFALSADAYYKIYVEIYLISS